MQNLSLLDEMDIRVKYDFFDYITKTFFKNEKMCVDQMEDIKVFRESNISGETHSASLNAYALNIALRSYQYKIEILLSTIQQTVAKKIDDLIIDYAIKDYEYRIALLKYTKECQKK